ncbi:Large ribosomal subunit protein uL15/eL18 - like 4 [Theobroma cacao]|nr:Large ribosomal subunit protein uL15/eL18 - like 4 [Theobroma cacao]
MAAMLSLSPNPPITNSLSLHSAFKQGNVRNLGLNPCHIIPVRTKQQQIQKQGTRSLVVVNRAAKIQVALTAPTVRFRLDNLGPQPGSRKKGKRKGRGISAGQGGSCGFGMRGQKSRSGPGVRKGFEGGQMPLYRRIPKLRGIAGGFQEGDEVSLETLKEKGLINPSGRERKLPLKILGDGELNLKLKLKARAFSASAKEKLEASGCSLTVLPGRKKWVKPSVAKNLARADEFFAKKRAAAAESNSA